jgi:hypothetical protein
MRKIWLENAAKCIAQQAPQSARFIYQSATEVFPQSKKLWFAWIQMETDPTEILKQAMDKSGKEIFVLRYSKHLWKVQHKGQEALEILKEKYSALKSENLLLALQKMYREEK